MGAGLLTELRRRGMLRTAVAYVVGGWFLLQVSDMLVDVFDGPEWVLPYLLGAVALGLPVVLVLRWFFATPDEAVAAAEARPFFTRRTNFVVISLLVGALGLSLWGNLRQPGEAPDSVSILIADFDNRTDNALFSGVLEDTLRIGIEVAPFVQVFPRNEATRIAASLPDGDDSKLSMQAAGLVALRESIDLVLGGRIERKGGTLELTVQAVSPDGREEVLTLTERADTDLDILNAVATLAKELRLELGDTEKPGGAGQNESFAVANLEAASEYLKAQDLQLDRKLEEAVTYYERALQHDPEFARAWAGLALTEQYLGRMEAANAHWQEALKRINSLTERGRLRTLGVYYLTNQQDYLKALETFEELVRRYPADNVALNNLAVSAFYSLNFERALEVGREVVERFPDHSGYRANLALYAMYAGRFGDAREVAQAVLERDEGNVYALTVLALTHAAEGRREQAEEQYRKMALTDQYGRTLAPEGLADLALADGNLGEALRLLDEAIAAAMNEGMNHSAAIKQTMRADALLDLERDEEAREALDFAIAHSSGDPAVLVPAALGLARLGEFERAREIETMLGDSLSRSRLAWGQLVGARIAREAGDLDAAGTLASAAIETADLWLARLERARINRARGMDAEADADIAVCEARIGEGIAAYLNDRPTLRLLRKVEEGRAGLTAMAQQATRLYVALY